MTETVEAWFVLAVVVAVFVAFIRERMRADVIALGAMSMLLVSGVLPVRDALSAFSNEAPITVAAMFVLSAALDRTGSIEEVGRWVRRLAARSPAAALAALMGGTMLISAFVNNTPVVVILTPITILLAQSVATPASKFLIPLSYASILGGTCTLIGTSTNLVVNGAAVASGLEPFGLFEITPIGLVYGVVGVVYMLLVGHRLLPHREVFSDTGGEARERHFQTEVLVPLGSPLVGRTIDDAELAKRLDYRIMDLIRDRISLAGHMQGEPLRAGDRLVLRTKVSDILSLRDETDVLFGTHEGHVLEPIASQNTKVMEGIVAPRSNLVSRRLADLNLRRQFGVYILALHRDGVNLGGDFDRIRLAFGDTLLLEGPEEGLRRLFEQGALVSLTEPAERRVRHDKRWQAIAAIAAVILLASFDIMPISAAAIAAATVVVIVGCLEPDEAYQAIHWPIIMLIFGMLALGKAMEVTGAGRMVVDAMLTIVEGYPPWVILATIYFATMLLTEFLSNTATAILLTPIAIGVATGLGLDPRPFVVAVMIAASASFSTPIGYQTNTFVYNAGGYRFRDFVIVGAPLNLILWLTATLLLPVFFPLVPLP